MNNAYYCIFLVGLILLCLGFALGISIGTTDQATDQGTDQVAGHTFDDLLDAIEWVESRGDYNAWGDDGKAAGSYQIHKIYVDDVNRIYKVLAKNCESEVYPKYTYEDRWDKDHSRMMAKTYMLYYLNKICWETKVEFNALPSNFEIMARIHNGGPNGYKKKSTEKYWLKVKKAMESR